MDQLSMPLNDEAAPQLDWWQGHNVVVDRGSKYSVSAARVTNNDELKAFLRRVKSHKKYAKATHNSFAVRVRKGVQLVERKSDDGETGAGMVMLRQLRKANAINMAVVVTRWYGGIKLHADRFAHVQTCMRLALEHML